MAIKRLSVPQVLINDVAFRIVPNSFTYDGGEVEINVVAASIGNGQVESVHSENVEGAVSSCSFDVFLDEALDGNIATWKSSIGSNTIKIQQSATGVGGSFSRTFAGMSLTNKVERNASADGVVSLEWMGDQMTIN